MAPQAVMIQNNNEREKTLLRQWTGLACFFDGITMHSF